MYRKSLLLLLAACFSVALPTSAQQPNHKVIFVLTSGDQVDWSMTLANMRNLIKGIAPDTVEVELVAYGPGLAFLKGSGPDAADIQTLESPHMHFFACHNSMVAQHLTSADLAPGVDVVPSGVIELMRKQEAGWTYIKAGR